MANYSSILAWRIPWTEEPGGLQSMGWQRVRHDWVTNHTHTHTLWSRNPTPGYLSKRNDNLSRAEAAQKSCLALPWWLGGEESTCGYRRHRFDSCSRRSPRATTAERGLESQEAATTVARCPGACALERVPWSVCSVTRGAASTRNRSLQLGKGSCSNRDPYSQKYTHKIINKWPV